VVDHTVPTKKEKPDSKKTGKSKRAETPVEADLNQDSDSDCAGKRWPGYTKIMNPKPRMSLK